MSKNDNQPKPFLANLIKGGVFLLLLTPFIFLQGSFFPFISPKTLFFCGVVEIIFFLWLFLAYFHKEYRPKLNALSVTVLILLGVMIISAIFGANPLRSFFSRYERMMGVITWLHAGALFFVLYSVFRRKRDWMQFFQFSVLVAAVFSIMNYLGARGVGLKTFTLSEKGGFTIGNTSFAGTYLLFNLFLAVYLLFRGTNKKEKLIWGLCFLIIFLSPIFFDFQLLTGQVGVNTLLHNPFLFLGESRAAALAFFAGLILLGLLYLAFHKKNKVLRRIGISFLILAVLISAFGAYLLSKPDNIVRQKFIELTTKSRLTIWGEAIQGIKESPWLGWGSGNFILIHQKYFNPSLFLKQYGGEVWFDRAHNIIFDKLSTTGILGLLAYLSIFGAGIYLLRRSYQQHKIDFLDMGLPIALLGAYFLQNLTVFDTVTSLLMFFIMLGFIGAVCSDNHASVSGQKFFTWNKDWDAVLVGILSFVFIFYHVVVIPFGVSRRMVGSLRQPDPQKRINQYQYIVKHSLVGSSQNIEYLNRQNRNRFYSNLDAVRKYKKTFLNELDYLSHALKEQCQRDPLNFKMRLTLGRVYNFYAFLGEDKAELALEQGKKSLEISPQNQQGYEILIQAYMYQGKLQKALDAAEKAVALEPRVKRYQMILVKIAQQIGDPELIKEKKAQAKEHIPSLQFEQGGLQVERVE